MYNAKRHEIDGRYKMHWTVYCTMIILVVIFVCFIIRNSNIKSRKERVLATKYLESQIGESQKFHFHYCYVVTDSIK